jgi:hypothetical protein
VTEPLIHVGYPILEMASHTVPYRTVLAPPPEFGVDPVQTGRMLADALPGRAAPGTDRTVAVHNEADHTVFARCRLLEAAEVGPGHPVTDRSSRPIVVTEGVVFAGQVTGDPEVVLDAARAQFRSAIQDFWNDSADFRTPRFSAPVTCRVASAPSAGGSTGTGPGPGRLDPEDLRTPAAEPPRADALEHVAVPPVRPARRRHLVPVLLALLAVAAAVVLVVLLLSL